jgi:hypothetical protein
MWTKWILKYSLLYHLLFPRVCRRSFWAWLWHEWCTRLCTSEFHPIAPSGRFISDAAQWFIFINIDLIFRSIYNQSQPYRDCESLFEFERRFSRLCTSISAEARTRASLRFISAYSLVMNKIRKDPSLASSYGPVSRETGNVPTSGQHLLFDCETLGENWGVGYIGCLLMLYPNILAIV